MGREMGGYNAYGVTGQQIGKWLGAHDAVRCVILLRSAGDV